MGDYLGPIKELFGLKGDLIIGENFPRLYEKGMEQYLPLWFHYLTAQSLYHHLINSSL